MTSRLVVCMLALISSSRIGAQEVIDVARTGLALQNTNVGGYVKKVEVLSDHSLVLLDASSSRVSLHDASGALVADLSPSAAPVSIVVDDADQAHVLASGGVISVFAVAGGALREKTESRLPFSASDICVVGGRRFVLATTADSLLYELQEDGSIARAFGEPVRPASADLRQAFTGQSYRLLNQGAIDCSAMSEQLVYVSLRLGLVRLYDLGGTPIWEITIPEFRGSRMSRHPRLDGCCVFRPNPKSQTTQTAVHAHLTEGAIWISIREWHSDRRITYELRGLDPRDGRQIFGSSWPMAIVGTAEDGVMIGFSEVPEAQLGIVPLPSTGR